MEEFLTTDELCQLFKVTRRTIERWRKDGLPFVKTGRLVRFEKAQVQAWLDKQSHNPQDQK